MEKRRGVWAGLSLALSIVVGLMVNLVSEHLRVPLGLGAFILILFSLGWVAVEVVQKRSSSGATVTGIGLEALRKVTPKDIRSDMGRGGKVGWLDRQIVSVSDLRAHGKVAITGPMKAGKTREAAELIERAQEDWDLVPREEVYGPGPGLRLLDSDSVRLAIRACLNRETPSLLFVDDLPFHYNGKGLVRLDEALAGLQESRNAFVVVTARTDELTEEHKDWLQRHGFLVAEIRSLEKRERFLLVDNAAAAFEVRLDAAARSRLAAEGDGTPELVLASFRQLRSEGLADADQRSAERVWRGSVVDAWASMRKYVGKRSEAMRCILDSLAVFHSAKVRPNETMVVQYAASIWRAENRWYRHWKALTQVRQGLEQLNVYAFVTHDGLVRYPDVAVEGQVAANEAQEELARFLVEHQHWLRGKRLRRFNSNAEPQMWSLFDLGVESQNRGDNQVAAEFYRIGLEVNTHFALHYNRGLALVALGENQHAVDEFTSAIAFNGESGAAYNNRAWALSNLELYQEAMVDLDRAAELVPGWAAPYHNRGLVYARQGEPRRAIVEYGLALACDPGYAEAYRGRGNAYQDLEEWEQSFEDYDRAIHLNPRLARAYIDRGHAYLQQGQPELALEDFDMAIRLEPENAAAHHNKGISLGILERDSEAIPCLSRSIELDPVNAEAFNGRGIAYQKTDELGHAIADFAEAIRLKPNYAEAYFNRGLAHALVEDLENAAKDFGTTVELDPQNVVGHDYLGLSLFKLGKFEEATGSFMRAIELEPEYSSAHYKMACAHALLGNLEEACISLEASVTLDESYREYALDDENFDGMREEACFQQIVDAEGEA